MHPKPSWEDRRHYPRIAWSGDARMIALSATAIEPAQHIYEVAGVNIGEGGVAISGKRLFGIRSRLLLEMTDPEISMGLQAVGEIAWIAPRDDHRGWYMGIAFADLADNTRAHIRALISAGDNG